MDNHTETSSNSPWSVIVADKDEVVSQAKTQTKIVR